MDDENPFTDPAVLQHQQPYTPYPAGSNAPTAQYVMPSTTPATAAARPTLQSTATVANPAVLNMTPTSQVDPPPAYSSSQKPLSNEELLKQQEALEKKAAELDRKEREINERAAAGGVYPNNFPPLPAFLPVKPCFHQDFDVAIPSQYRDTVKQLYYVWLGYILTLLINIITSIVYVVVGGNQAGSTLGFAFLILVLGVPCSYVCWMRAVYNAFKADSSFNFFLFFFVFFIQICATVVFALGVPGWGTCGFIVMIEVFDESVFCGILALLVSVMFTALVVVMVLLMQRVHNFYRMTDASFAKAQSEFSTNVMSNRHVQTAARTATANAASAAASGAYNP